MAYYIYENSACGPHKAVIHVGTCSFCNDGKGRHGVCDSRHAKWHGPYELQTLHAMLPPGFQEWSITTMTGAYDHRQEISKAASNRGLFALGSIISREADHEGIEDGPDPNC